MLYCEKYKIAGKIDYFNTKTGELVERKNKISYLHKGYMYQIWGQYFALREAGHRVRTLSIHSKTDNKKYNVPLPTQKDEKDFASLLQKMRNFDPKTLLQTHTDKNGKESIYGSLAW
jgi:CRISPR-associated protein Cas4